MKLYIKEKVFTWGDQFTVKDERGNDKYVVEGEVFSWGKKLHVYDMTGREVAATGTCSSATMRQTVFRAPESPWRWSECWCSPRR